MERLEFEFTGGALSRPACTHALVGVVSSGNLEVLMEKAALDGRCKVVVNTSTKGFGEIWRAVLADFFVRHPLADVRVSINDVGATPAIVSLRLDQALDAFAGKSA